MPLLLRPPGAIVTPGLVVLVIIAVAFVALRTWRLKRAQERQEWEEIDSTARALGWDPDEGWDRWRTDSARVPPWDREDPSV